MNDAGLICIAAFLAPRRGRPPEGGRSGRPRAVPGRPPRRAAGSLPRSATQEGLYATADAGEIANFPGVSRPYEEPTSPDLVLPTDKLPVDQCVDEIVKLLQDRGIVSA